MATIRFDGVRKVFTGDLPTPVVAIERFDLSVAPDEFVAILGPSGCGKSTLLYLLGGFLELSGGEILLDDAPVAGPGPASCAFPYRPVGSQPLSA